MQYKINLLLDTKDLLLTNVTLNLWDILYSIYSLL